MRKRQGRALHARSAGPRSFQPHGSAAIRVDMIDNAYMADVQPRSPSSTLSKTTLEVSKINHSTQNAVGCMTTERAPVSL